MKPIRVMIVDDHDMVRIGLRVFIETCEDLQFVGEASSGEEAIRQFETLRPDVVLMDLIMPGIDGVSAARAICAAHPDAHIIALTSFDDETLIHNALKAGVTGYLLKDISMDRLAQAIHDAFLGKPTLAQEATQALIRAASRPPTTGYDLTPGELTVLELLAQGLSNGEIAERLVISTSTVKKHVSRILGKLNVSNRAEAAVLAIQHELVHLGH